MGRLLDIARAYQANLPTVRETRPGRQTAATDADLITFRRGMYNPAPDGTFTFEGRRANAKEVHAATEDKDGRIKALIEQRRRQSPQITP